MLDELDSDGNDCDKSTTDAKQPYQARSGNKNIPGYCRV